MTAVVVQLRKRVCSSQAWTNQEIAEFYRVTELLGQAGLAVGLDGGTTDEGDVWQVFFREDTGDVLAHFAKIDGDYVIAIPATGDVLRGKDLREMIASMMDRQPTLMARAQKAKGNVHLHPTMMLSSFIVMIYLLAVESSEAVAADDVADALALAAQSIADAEAEDAATGTGQGDVAPVEVAVHRPAHHYDEDRGPSDLQSLVITVAMGQAPTLSTVSASAAQPVQIKKLESPAYIDRFTSTMTAVVAAAASILGAGNHDEEFGNQNGADLQLADLQHSNAASGKLISEKQAAPTSQDRHGDTANHTSTSLTLPDQTAQIAITVAPVVVADASVVSIKLALPGVLAIDRVSGNIVSVVTAPSAQHGGIAIDGFSVVISPKSHAVQKTQGQAQVQAQPAVANEGSEAAVAAPPVAAPAPAPAETAAPTPPAEQNAPQLAKDQAGSSTPVPQQSKIAVEPIKAGTPDQLIELKFQVIPPSVIGGLETVILVPSDLEDFPTIIDDLDDAGDDKTGPIKPGSGKDAVTPVAEEGEFHILPFDGADKMAMDISIAHFANTRQPLDLTNSPGQDLVVYSGGSIVINGFELGVDRLVIEHLEANSGDFTAYWTAQGILKVDFGGGESITMIGLVVDGVTL